MARSTKPSLIYRFVAPGNFLTMVEKSVRWAPLATIILILCFLIGAVSSQQWDSALRSIIQDRYIRGVVWFTVEQAGLSAVLSVILAIPVARALSRLGNFRGRDAVLRLFALPLVLPGIVVVLGLITVYGRQGWLAQIATSVGLSFDGDIYGLRGVLLAHVFFDMPLAVRLLLPLWMGIPQETWRLSAQLDLKGWHLWRMVEWPAIRSGLLPVGVLIFLLCFVSFVPVLILGGGPAATTFEVAIFQALRYEGDVARVTLFAIIQAALAIGLLVIAYRIAGRLTADQTLRLSSKRFDGDDAFARISDRISLGLAALFVLLPVGAVLADGVLALARGGQLPGFSRVVLNSFILGAAAALLTPCLALILVSRRHSAMREVSAAASLILPPAAMAAGLFLILRLIDDPFMLALPAAGFVGIMTALPYAVRIIDPALSRYRARYERLCATLNILGIDRWRLIIWPNLRPHLTAAAAFAALVGSGDLGAIALFGSDRTATLPYYIFESIGAYRWPQAHLAAAILVILSFAILTLIERSMNGRDHD